MFRVVYSVILRHVFRVRIDISWIQVPAHNVRLMKYAYFVTLPHIVWSA